MMQVMRLPMMVISTLMASGFTELFPFASPKMRTKIIVQVMWARTCRTGGVGSYWTKPAFVLNRHPTSSASELILATTICPC